MKLHGIKLIEAYREHPEQFYPMYPVTEQMPDRNEYGEVNIGWWAGLLDEKRPFFAECWAVYGITMFTLIVSAEGIEEKTAEELDAWFQEVGYYRQKNPGSNLPRVDKFTGKDGHEYFTINLAVGVEEEPAKIEGGRIEPWSILNEYNQNAGNIS